MHIFADSLEQEETIVVDFVREKPIGVGDLANLVKVNPVTIRRWFKRGLDHAKLGGKVVTTLEALNRFQVSGDPQPATQTIVVDRDTLAALQSLKSRGITFGTETCTDGLKRKASA